MLTSTWTLVCNFISHESSFFMQFSSCFFIFFYRLRNIGCKHTKKKSKRSIGEVDAKKKKEKKSNGYLDSGVL